LCTFTALKPSLNFKGTSKKCPQLKVDSMTPSTLALALYAGWTLCLVAAIAALRTCETWARRRPPNGFVVSGDDVSAFSGRLCRAHANCYENLPAFAAIVLVASISGQMALTDPLALWLVAARVGQSVTHLVSTRPWALNLRFVFFVPQIAVPLWWVARWVSVA
jgi:uncharacterized MAPEG superfamily protein